MTNKTKPSIDPTNIEIRLNNITKDFSSESILISTKEYLALQASEARARELENDLKMCREIGVKQQRAVNDRQYQEKLKLKEKLRICVEQLTLRSTEEYYVDHYVNKGTPKEFMNMKTIVKLQAEAVQALSQVEDK